MNQPQHHGRTTSGWSVLSLLPGALRRWLSRWRSQRFSRRFRFQQTDAWNMAVPGRSWQASAEPSGPGLNLFGYLRGEFGLAEAARAYARAALQGGIPVSLKDVDIATPHSNRDERALTHLASAPLPHLVDAVFVNPDNFSQAIAEPVERLHEHAYRVGFWFWELPQMPPAWSQTLAQVDEVWVASQYVADAFRGRTNRPVIRIPYPLYSPQASALARADFGLPQTAFVFLVSFDFNSSIERKNPGGAILAFREAFPPERDDVRMLVKSSHGHRNAAGLASLLALAGGDARILIRDDVLPAPHLHALQACCDAYVSLHRAEGLGLGMAECMSMGKPVVATGWSGNLEFMSRETSMLVDYRLVPVPDAEYPFAEGQHWAEPDLAHAARLMRRLADDHATASALGAAAARHVADVLSPGLAAAAMAERLQYIMSENRDGKSSPQEQ
ncbi:glycosyltransferase [Stenotrophomonas sp. HITSZ_GD]|uniref:glycosyltransferase n=1 Tax=Stenotrophomonas sp. HITSZ_GD TaxID=3037248 RepID=UPI00240E7BE1|nr:glycosyltransferase [Stenotrophomonas sp. HITSZ_GD]MDG2525632.1 glycosyltransferase [Stenotrophomonas sp. HITSZ_GD]